MTDDDAKRLARRVRDSMTPSDRDAMNRELVERQMIVAQHHCPTCGESMTFRSKDDLIVVGDRTKAITSEAWWCDSDLCGEAIFDAAALAKRESVYDELKGRLK